ncbi:hypothetical protein GJ496_000704 [Pomphorhynchus laevis]|nr:hypothetical protein GJ496_000704 [Pomphorhynchus laevis]
MYERVLNGTLLIDKDSEHKTRALCYMQYLTLCLNNNVIPKGLHIKLNISLAKRNVNSKVINKFQSKLTNILKRASIEVTRLIRNYYGRESNTHPSCLNESLYNQLLVIKRKKLSKLVCRKVSALEIKNVEYHPNRWCRKSKRLVPNQLDRIYHEDYVVNLSEQIVS